MPQFTWVEDNESRSATIVRLGKKAQSTYVKSWKIFGSTDDVAVHADVNQTIKSGYMYWQYPDQPLNQLYVDSYTLEYLGDDAWQLKVTYIKEGAEDGDQNDPLKRTRSFDTTGGTAHKTQAETEARFGADVLLGGGLPPDMKKAIGVDGDSVAGVDVVIPALQWTETYDVPNAFITRDYIKSLADLTGSVNNGNFRGFAAGEVLFVGASGSQEWDQQKGDGPWNLTYKFIASRNANNIAVGDIAGISKKGHEYLWVKYEPAVSGNDLLRRPKYVYVNGVYPEKDFSALGLGVA